jgi:NADH-quinone oxidoreductase subunit J
MSADQIIFIVFAPISIVSAIAMVVQRKAVYAALFLVVNFFTIAVFYLVLGSPFLFVVQIAVYAGAIMVLFLFVIMLLGVDREESLVERLRGQRPLAIALGVGVALEVFFAVRLGIGFHTRPPDAFDIVSRNGSPQALAEVLFTKYFLPFEITSILLIIAAVAALVMTRRQVTIVRTEAGEHRRDEAAA